MLLLDLYFIIFLFFSSFIGVRRDGEEALNLLLEQKTRLPHFKCD